VIEGVILPGEPGPRFHPAPIRRVLAAAPKSTSRHRVRLSTVAALGVLVIVTAIGFHSPIGRAFADLTGGGRYEGLEFQSVRTKTLHGRTLVVEGELINRSADAMALPAIKLTLRANGRDLYTWLVEPVPRTLAAGRTIGFRSMVAPPDPGQGEVVFSLTGRRNDIVGMQ
jgi:hypothetical protein